jgi:hypothetical protein
MKKIINWLVQHWISLTPKAKTLGITALAYAATMSIPESQHWMTSNLGQHPFLAGLGHTALVLVALYQKPFVQQIVDSSLHIKQVSPDKVVITQEPSPITPVSKEL